MSDSEKFKTFELIVSSFEVNETNEEALETTMRESSSTVSEVSLPIEIDVDRQFSDAEGSAKAAYETNKELTNRNEKALSTTDTPDSPEDIPVGEGEATTKVKTDPRTSLKKKLLKKHMSYLEGDKGVIKSGIRIKIELWVEDGEQMDNRKDEE